MSLLRKSKKQKVWAHKHGLELLKLGFATQTSSNLLIIGNLGLNPEMVCNGICIVCVQVEVCFFVRNVHTSRDNMERKKHSMFRNLLIAIAVLWLIFFCGSLEIESLKLSLFKNAGYTSVSICKVAFCIGDAIVLKSLGCLKFLNCRVKFLFRLYARWFSGCSRENPFVVLPSDY